MNYDLIIIGAGPGGYEAALHASKNNLKVLLIEKEHVGGVCLNEGCIPTKSYYTIAELIQLNQTFGLDTEFSWFKAYKRKNDIVTNLRNNINLMLKNQNVELINGSASLISNNEVLVNNEVYQGSNIIIATGSRNKIINIKGIEKAIDSTDFLNLESLPKKIAIIGAGVIGVEAATILNSFGVEVSLIEAQSFILPSIDVEVSRRLTFHLKQSGIKVITNATVSEISDNGLKYISKNIESYLEVDKVMISLGRMSNVESLNLEKLNIDYNQNGIVVNNHFETNIKNIYAIGDCCISPYGKVMLAHFATSSGIYVVDKILNKENLTNFNIVPSVIFSIPIVSSVGVINENSVKSYYRTNGMAHATNNTDGFIKLYLDDSYIVGATIIGHQADCLIHQIAIIINNKIKINQLKDIIYAHPTISEVLLDCFKNIK